MPQSGHQIAHVDAPYSRYFHALAGRLTQGAGPGARDRDAVALLSSPAYRLYSGTDRCVVWSPGRASPVHPLPAAYMRSGWMSGDKDTAAVFAHVVEWFKQQFSDEQTEVCLVFSDVRPFSLAAQTAARELGVVCLFFEPGAFRFSTASLSTQGLN